jgi:hypothetical protein
MTHPLSTPATFIDSTCLLIARFPEIPGRTIATSMSPSKSSICSPVLFILSLPDSPSAKGNKNV